MRQSPVTGNMNSSPFLNAIFGTDKPPISDIELFTEQYPWCALGHKLLFAALCAQGNEAYVSHLPKTAVYVFNRSELYTLAQAAPSDPISGPIPASVSELAPELADPLLEIEADISLEQQPDTEAQQVVVVGGDYFNSADLNATQLEEKNPIDRFIKLNPRMLKVQPPPQDGKVSLLDVTDDDFMTETLAKIYADQSLYQLAREAYKKLILLYPKKSDYFAALIQEIKLNANR